jgi:hypothetical protein
VRWGARIESISRSLPFLEMGVKDVERMGGRRWDRCVARWENVVLLWDESLA